MPKTTTSRIEGYAPLESPQTPTPRTRDDRRVNERMVQERAPLKLRAPTRDSIYAARMLLDAGFSRGTQQPREAVVHVHRDS